jgi:hypothetical protein
MAERDNLVDSFRREFTQKSGPRKNQRYTIKRGASGLPIRVYASGDTALASTAFKGEPGPRRQQLARRLRSQNRAQIKTAEKLA